MKMQITFRKTSLLLFLLVVGTSSLLAQQVNKEVALAKANKFMDTQANASDKRAQRRAPQLVLANNRNEFYVFNDAANGGYVVVSGEERMPDILAFSVNGIYNEEEIPCNMKAWLDGYAKQVSYLRAHPEAKSVRRAHASKANISNLLDCWFNQREPYNKQCPTSGGRCLTGCVATAMAQIMYYHKWPNQTLETIPAYTTATLKISVPGSPVTTIDWANIRKSYNNGDTYSPEQENAIATLMKLCGSSVEMDYTTTASAASTYDAGIALIKYFGYNDLIEEVYRDNFSTDEWEQLVYDELNAKRPVLYSGQSSKDGHAFVLDGYKDGYFHVNWGWGGSDAYVSMTGGGNWQGYTTGHSAVINILPDNGSNAKRYAVIDGTKMTVYYDKNISHRSGTVLVHMEDWRNYKTDITDFVFDASFANIKLRSLSGFFEEWEKLQTISGMQFLNTANVTDMSWMFANCAKLTDLDVSKFNTDKVTNMATMFYGCGNLTSLDVSKFNTANVTDMSWMFGNCSSLTNLDVSKFNTDKVTSMAAMFSGCENLTSLDVSKFNTANVTDMSWMFGNCAKLANLDVSGFITDKVTSMAVMFSGCENLTNLDVSKFNTTDVTDMSWMFRNCVKLANLDVSGFITDKVTSMAVMFSGCENLTNLDVSKFNTTDVTDMSWMFGNCVKLANLDVSGFKTDKVTNMNSMFYSCEHLTSLDVSKFNTTDVTDMSWMFGSCANLANLDVSGFKTGNVINMQGMFTSCDKLGSLDLSEFNTSKVTTTAWMFGNCSNLTTIYVSERWDMSKVETSEYMFYNCGKLIGGAGTKYEYGLDNCDYARIDEGTTNPGYFTYKAALFTITYKVEGEVYATANYAAGATIIPETAPVKEGYTFSGWTGLPETMPAQDITITGAFSINVYTITYKIDGGVVGTQHLKFGEKITPIAVQPKAGYTFSGWIDVPETMPAHDIVIEGTYTTGVEAIHSAGQEVKWFTITGQPIDTPRKGINIKRTSNGKTRKVLIK